MGNIKVLVPVAEVKSQEIKMAQRPLNLKGKVIGLMWNKKSNGDHLLKILGDALQMKFPISGTLMTSKPRSTAAAPAEVLEELSAKCNLVILAIAD